MGSSPIANSIVQAVDFGVQRLHMQELVLILKVPAQSAHKRVLQALGSAPVGTVKLPRRLQSLLQSYSTVLQLKLMLTVSTHVHAGHT